MPNTVLVGAQWGDEGKGKIIDVLTRQVQWVVRFQGGNNAGHTVETGKAKFVLHLIPSGILHEGIRCVIGNGLVVDPQALIKEIDEIEQMGVRTQGRLFVSERAHLVMPYHRLLDAHREGRLVEGEKIGTTQRGIGPAYADKAARVGLRMAVLRAPDRDDLIRRQVEAAQAALTQQGAEARLDAEAIVAQFRGIAERLAPHIQDTATMVNEAIARGESVLFEGAQGTMLDVDFGTYPFVTSSNATAGGACTGTGVPPTRIDQAVGVIKAYTTRVGEGPFPTELRDAMGEHLRRKGHEFGATTGRPRRCGWFDNVVARYAAMVNGIDGWAMTKLDVLDEVETIRICVAYECDGRRLETMPTEARVLARCQPVYEEMPGWLAPTREAKTFDELPAAAQTYLRRLEALTGVPIWILSVGPGRHSTMILHEGLKPRD